MEGKDDALDLIDFACRAIDLYAHSCFRMQYLYPLCRRMRPEKVVETGVHNGISTAFILNALGETSGRLHSIDLPNIQYQTDQGQQHEDLIPGSMPGLLVPDKLRSKWDLILGDSREKLPTLLESLGEVDIFHHDSMHTRECMTFEYQTVWPYLRDDGLLLSDDATWNNAFEDFCRDRTSDYRVHRGIGIAKKSKSS